MKHIVLLTTHKGASFLPRALASLNAVFSDRHWLFFAGVDASPDDSFKLLTSTPLTAAARSIVSYPKADTLGQAKNRVIAQALPYIQPDDLIYWLDDDDELLRPIHDVAAALLQSDALYALGDCTVRSDYQLVRHPAKQNFGYADFAFAAQRVVCRGSLYHRFPLFFDEAHGVEDSPAWARLAFFHDIWPSAVDANCLLYYTERPTSATASLQRKTIYWNLLHSKIKKMEQSPSSFATIVTSDRSHEFALFYRQLRKYHPAAPLFVLADADVKLPKDDNLLEWRELKTKDWTSIICAKPDIVATACYACGDTMFLDVDVTLLAPVVVPNRTDFFAVPQPFGVNNNTEYGTYSTGYVFVSSVGAAAEWSRAIDVAKKQPLGHHGKHGIEQVALEYFRPKALDPTVHNVSFLAPNIDKFTLSPGKLWHKDRLVRSLHYHFRPDNVNAANKRFAERVNPLLREMGILGTHET